MSHKISSELTEVKIAGMTPEQRNDALCVLVSNYGSEMIECNVCNRFTDRRFNCHWCEQDPNLPGEEQNG